MVSIKSVGHVTEQYKVIEVETEVKMVIARDAACVTSKRKMQFSLELELNLGFEL